MKHPSKHKLDNQIVVWPLDTIIVECDDKYKYLEVFDGKGVRYFISGCAGKKEVRFLARGSAGDHVAAFFDGNGAKSREIRFKVIVRTVFECDRLSLQNLWNYTLAELLRNRKTIVIDGEVVEYFGPWVRDETHISKATKYFQFEPVALQEQFLKRQRETGMLYDYMRPPWFVPERKAVFGAEYYEEDERNKIRWERFPTEADVEYLAVEAIYYGWQVSGNGDWLRKQLPMLEKALNYLMTHPLRWDARHLLVKRALTIDTWDFKYHGDKAQSFKNSHETSDALFNIKSDTPMALMHGDNTGLYQACRQMELFYRHLKDGPNAKRWQDTADALGERIMGAFWNGAYFNHWRPIVDTDKLPGGESGMKCMTLSNVYNLSRGLLNIEQARRVVEAYEGLIKELGEGHCAEWVAAHPPWEPSFNGIKPGEYVNGGILPLVAGELAKGAFRAGREDYGLSILDRLNELVERNPRVANGDKHVFAQPTIPSALTPEGKPSNGVPPAWGAAAVISAILEGLCGIRDEGCCYYKASLLSEIGRLPINQLYAVAHYPASNTYAAIAYNRHAETPEERFQFTGSGEVVCAWK